MIKRCPSCSRTYSDQSISFCLADGALLSAPYDSPRSEPPPTEILPSTRTPPSPTQPANPVIQTITSLPHYGHGTERDNFGPQRKSTLTWIVFAVASLGFITGLVLIFRYVSHNSDETPTVESSPGTLIASVSPSPLVTSAASPMETKNSNGTAPTVLRTPAEKKPDDPSQVGPEPSPSSPGQTSAPATSSPTDQIFLGREVDQKVRILSKPEAPYTEQARNNQVSGVVVLRAVFSSAGTVTNIRAVSGLPDGLTERAIAAARQIKFVPAVKDGHPVSMWMELQYNFNLY